MPDYEVGILRENSQILVSATILHPVPRTPSQDTFHHQLHSLLYHLNLAPPILSHLGFLVSPFLGQLVLFSASVSPTRPSLFFWLGVSFLSILLSG